MNGNDGIQRHVGLEEIYAALSARKVKCFHATQQESLLTGGVTANIFITLTGPSGTD